MTLATLILTLTTLTLLFPLTTLTLNLLSARRTSLHYILSPLTPHNLSWRIATALFRPWLCHFRWFRALDWTCCWQDDDTLHKALGLNFIIVCPGGNVWCSSDARTIEGVLKAWKEWAKPGNVNEILGTFGQNVDTSNGEDWIRHRKLTAPCFSERASSTVWSTALEHSRVLLDKWLSSSDEPPSGTSEDSTNITTLIPDTSTLALNVISAVAFSAHQVNSPAAGHTMSLREALTTVMSTSISPALEGVLPWVMRLKLQPLLPTSLKKLLLAMHEFNMYLDETVTRERERDRSTAGESTVPNLMSSLIRANDATKTAGVETKARLSDQELRGNIFIFTVGGLESTAITLAYAMALLAVHPEIQEWLYEEVREVSSERDKNQEYASVFPRLKRVMAVMYETLRVYGPSPPLPRGPVSASAAPQVPITSPPSALPSEPNNSSSTTLIPLPPNTQLMLNSWACHTSSTHFSSPKIWNPKRWVHTPPTLSSGGSTLADEKLVHPTSSSGFFAWGAGPRICPGMKFSQVEFAGVMASVVREVKVEVATGVDGSEDEAKAKVLEVLRDSCAEPLLLHVRQPEKLELRMLRRDMVKV